MASDPAFNIAAKAGVGSCPNYQSAIDEAKTLLYNHSFNGNTYTKFSSAETSVANILATYLDNYNNNQACPTSPPPVLP